MSIYYDASILLWILCGADGMTTPNAFFENHFLRHHNGEQSNFLKKVNKLPFRPPIRYTPQSHVHTGSNGSGYQISVKLLVAFGFMFEDKFIAFAYGEEVYLFLILWRVGV